MYTRLLYDLVFSLRFIINMLDVMTVSLEVVYCSVTQLLELLAHFESDPKDIFFCIFLQ